MLPIGKKLTECKTRPRDRFSYFLIHTAQVKNTTTKKAWALNCTFILSSRVSPCDNGNAILPDKASKGVRLRMEHLNYIYLKHRSGPLREKEWVRWRGRKLLFCYHPIYLAPQSPSTPCQAKLDVSSRILRRNFRLIHFAHLVQQFCEVDLRRRRSKSWYIVQHFSRLCAKIMACIGHFWPFRSSIAFAKFLKKLKTRSEVASTLKHLIIIQWDTFFHVSVYSRVKTPLLPLLIFHCLSFIFFSVFRISILIIMIVTFTLRRKSHLFGRKVGGAIWVVFKSSSILHKRLLVSWVSIFFLRPSTILCSTISNKKQEKAK